MTIEEAINVLKNTAWLGTDKEVGDVEKAIMMAVKALKAQTDGDTISRQAVIDIDGLDVGIRCLMCKNPMHTDRGCDGNCKYDEKLYEKIIQILDERIKPLPSAQLEQDREFIKLTVRNSNDRPYYSIIYLEFDDNGVGHDFEGYSSYSLDVISDYLKKYFMPSAQPERTCVNCGRTANNGGWYADGRTRCPIEEHYALPKDGYCHLWEKRNVTDDDYPERREE